MNEVAELAIVRIMRILVDERDEYALMRLIQCCKRHVRIAKLNRFYARQIAAQRLIVAWRHFRKFGGPTFRTYTEGFAYEMSRPALDSYQWEGSGAAVPATTAQTVIYFDRVRCAWLNLFVHVRHRLRPVLHDHAVFHITAYGDVLRTLTITAASARTKPINLSLSIGGVTWKSILMNRSHFVWLVNLPVVAINTMAGGSCFLRCDSEHLQDVSVVARVAFLRSGARDMLLQHPVWW